jgi:hypothetical protein
LTLGDIEQAIATIDYVATDGAGNTATSTRTVIIEPAQSPSIVPDTSATTDQLSVPVSTTATSSFQ